MLCQFDPASMSFLYSSLKDLVKESSKTVAELYRSFSRAASLVPTAETNICCEELCYKILALGADWRTKVKTLSM